MATTQEEIVAGIAEIVEEVTGIDAAEVTFEKSFVDDLDIDSLSLVEIAVQLEDKYSVKVPDEDLASLRTVGDAITYVQRMEAEEPQLAAEMEAKFKEGQEN
ncbi:meromycolate extension acyl carrier protein AcpM [Nocardia xishanensis]